MLILSLDTSSAAGSAAVACDGIVLVERRGDAARNHGERLPRELMTVLEDAGVELRAIDRFAIATGPGSFTGLRVGIATMQGLALAQQKLVAPVSTFEALAFLSADLGLPSSDLGPPSSLIATWIDAHRGEVFAALYASDGVTPLVPPTSFTPEATLEAWRQALEGDVTVRFAGDGALKYADVIGARLGSRATLPEDVAPLAGAIARIAARDGERAVRPHAVVPVYVRRSAVELARDRRQANG